MLYLNITNKLGICRKISPFFSFFYLKVRVGLKPNQNFQTGSVRDSSLRRFPIGPVLLTLHLEISNLFACPLRFQVFHIRSRVFVFPEKWTPSIPSSIPWGISPRTASDLSRDATNPIKRVKNRFLFSSIYPISFSLFYFYFFFVYLDLREIWNSFLW